MKQRKEGGTNGKCAWPEPHFAKSENTRKLIYTLKPVQRNRAELWWQRPAALSGGV